MVWVRFESPANTGTSVKNIRAKYAQKYYDQYANKEVTPMISNCGHDENGDIRAVLPVIRPAANGKSVHGITGHGITCFGIRMRTFGK